MFAEEQWKNGAGGPERARARARSRSRPRRRPGGPVRPGPAAGKGRLPGDGAAEPARQRPRGRRRDRRRAAAEEPRRSGQRPDTGTGADPPGEPGLSRRQQRKRRRQKSELRGEPEPPGPGAGPAQPSGRSAALRARMEERLLGARFRFLNEQLYTCSSRDAAELFRADPEAFRLYHRGFARQVARWPENPVARIARSLRRRPASLVVADFGCGDCALAASVRNTVHCFDLVPLSPHVTVCDMAQVPLADASVDVAVFCLALMGTNLQEILEEANRVLKTRGTLMVAEVASRFEDMRAFLSAMAQLGFKSVSKDLSSSYFYLLEFTKTGPPRGRPVPGLHLRPCLYKRR
ncbi:ribosomal RNA-processing protein 8 [Pterocles gutturalis]